MAARFFTLGASRAPCVAVVGSPVARSVTMAYRNTLPINPRKRRAVSCRPLFSMRLSRSRISAAVISLMGRLASGRARFSRSHLFLLSVELAASFASLFPMTSAAIAPNVLFAETAAKTLSCFRCADGSTPAARSLRASSRLVRASPSDVAERLRARACFPDPKNGIGNARVCCRWAAQEGASRIRQRACKARSLAPPS